MPTHLGLTDILIMSFYMLLLLGVGMYFARQQRTLKSYLLADQDVHWVIVGISVMAALFSGITYLGAPAETFFFDLRYVWLLVSFLIATPITTLLFLPAFRKAKIVTAYEFLERRFDVRLRRIASSLFILRVVFYLGLAIYAPALAIVDVTGWPMWTCVILTGAIATIYTVFGGMKAVIWTDTIQFLILVGGIFVILGVAIYHIPGGLPAAWNFAVADGKTNLFNFGLDPTIRITFWGALIGGTCVNLIQLVTDQISVQRYITAPSLKDSQRALWLKFWVTLPVVSLFYLAGTVLYGYYRALPERVPSFANSHLVPNLAAAHDLAAKLENDRLLPYFVTRELPSPLPGLLIAAILGATIAVVSAGINALATATLMDFRRSGPDQPTATEGKQFTYARRLTAYFGVIVTLLALFVIPYFGSIIEAIGRISGLFGGPLLGVFFLAVLSPKANGTGALLGAACGFIAGLLATFSKQLFDYPISFLWIAFLATILTYGVGYLASILIPKAKPTPVPT